MNMPLHCKITAADPESRDTAMQVIIPSTEAATCLELHPSSDAYTQDFSAADEQRH